MMDSIPNRKQRRLMAKEAGFMKKKQKASEKERAAMRERAAEFGKQIHLSNTERVLRQRDEIARQKEQKYLQDLVDKGYSQSQAIEMLEALKNESDS